MTSSVNEEEIINLVKNKRFLWDSKDPDYKNISLKTEEFAQIGTHFNLSGRWSARPAANLVLFALSFAVEHLPHSCSTRTRHSFNWCVRLISRSPAGEEVRRKWRSLRSGFRRELLARSNKKPKPKTKQWKHFSKLLFLRDSESGRDGLSDNEFDDNHQNNSSLCINQQDNVSTEDFSDLMHINSPVPNLSVEHVTDEYKFNLIPTNAPTDKPDKNCQEVTDNTQFKLLPPNHLNPAIQPQQIYFVKTNGMSDMSQLVLIKKPDQNSATTAQITNHHQEEPHHHHAAVEQQPQPQLTTIKTTVPAPIVNRTNDLLINSFKSNNTQSNGNNCMAVAPKAKKRKEESDEDGGDLYADDYFGRMVASLMKSIDPAERMPVRLAILKLIDDCKKTNENNK